MDIVLPRQVENSKILRGRVLNVAVINPNGRPLEFLEEEGSNIYKSIVKLDGLEGKIDKVSGKKKAETLKIISEVKLRPALIIQPNEYNQKTSYPFVTILPLANIPKNKKGTNMMKRLVEKNDLDVMHYLGHNSYVTVNDPRRVYKNMLFEFKDGIERKIDELSFNIIMRKFANCFEIDEIDKCEECVYNYDNYIYAFEQIASQKEKDA